MVGPLFWGILLLQKEKVFGVFPKKQMVSLCILSQRYKNHDFGAISILLRIFFSHTASHVCVWTVLLNFSAHFHASNVWMCLQQKHLKMDGWKTSLSYWGPAYFQRLLLVSGRVHSGGPFFNTPTCVACAHPFSQLTSKQWTRHLSINTRHLASILVLFYTHLFTINWFSGISCSHRVFPMSNHWMFKIPNCS